MKSAEREFLKEMMDFSLKLQKHNQHIPHNAQADNEKLQKPSPQRHFSNDFYDFSLPIHRAKLFIIYLQLIISLFLNEIQFSLLSLAIRTKRLLRWQKHAFY